MWRYSTVRLAVGKDERALFSYCYVRGNSLWPAIKRPLAPLFATITPTRNPIAMVSASGKKRELKRPQWVDLLAELAMPFDAPDKPSYMVLVKLLVNFSIPTFRRQLGRHHHNDDDDDDDHHHHHH